MAVFMAYGLLPLASFAEEPLRQITVTGEAEKSFAPDKADVFVVVEGRAPTLAEAKKKHDDLLTGLHEVTAKFSIAKDDIKTLSDSINPQYDYVQEPNGTGKQVLRGYSAEHRIQITLNTLDKMGDFINTVVAKGIDRVEQVSYGLKNSDDAEMEVTLTAVRDAKFKAEKIMGALDSRLGKVLSVNTNSGGYQPISMPMAMMTKSADMVGMGGAPEAASVPSGDVKINKSVTVQFEIQ